MIDIKEIKQRIQPITRRYAIRRLVLFGSYARGEVHASSDIDLLVDIEDPDLSLIQFVQMKREIEQLLQSRVDLVEYNTIKPRIKEQIFKEQISLL